MNNSPILSTAPPAVGEVKIMQPERKLTDIFYTCGLIFIAVCCFFIPLSSSLMGASAALFSLFWILSGRIVKLPELLRENPLALLALLLFGLMCAALFYGPASVEDSLSALKKYRELLFSWWSYRC